MKKGLYVIMFISLLVFTIGSCKDGKDSRNVEEKKVTGHKDLINGSIIDNDGVRLDYSFNPEKSTVVFNLKGESFELKQDTTASGIKYSNDIYEYREHHGNVNLLKEGEIIFEYNK